jgi:hypothetical protein
VPNSSRRSQSRRSEKSPPRKRDPDDGELTASFDGRAINYGFGELDTLVPGYAATIPRN